MNKNQKGFSVVEALLISVIVGVLGFVGWYVYHSKNNKTAEVTNSSTTKTQDTTTTLPNTSKWTKYSSSNGQFSLSYNPEWAKLECTTDGLSVTFAPVAQYVTCDKAGSSLALTISTGDYKNDHDFSTGFCKDISKKAIVVDEISGDRQECTISRTATAQPNDMPNGTKQVQYFFYTNSKSYYVTCVEYPDQHFTSNIVTNFDAMVQQTLVFTK